MTRDKEKILYEKYPDLFRDKDKPPQETCMCWGCACGNGWFDILDKLCEKISKLDKDEDFRFLQIKEKFGGLRVYVINGNEKIFGLISDAEDESLETCEHCGTKENVDQRNNGWIYTLCNNCYHKKNSNPSWIL